MKLLSVEQARAMWLFPTAEINPTGKYLLPILAELIKKYKFSNVPNIAEAIQKNQGIILGQGAYVHAKQGEIQADFGIYNDGLVADTKTATDASEAMLNDVLNWIHQEYGLQHPKIIRKQYSSKIYVETKKLLSSLNMKLARFEKLLTEKSAGFGNVVYKLGGINFTTEQASPIVPPIFRFERAEKFPYSSNRYYSFAGLKTADHLELLDQLESILG